MSKIKKIAVALFFLVPFFSLAAQTSDTASAVNIIDWQNKNIVSTVTLDARASGIILPSGRETALRIIEEKLPELTGSALFSLIVDSSTTLGDSVTDGVVSLPQVFALIDRGSRTPLWFSQDLKSGTMANTVELSSLRQLFVRHKSTYKPKKPLETMPTRAYTGIIIDARGSLPVHGEFTRSKLNPSMFPKVWDSGMTLAYERNMVAPQTAWQEGIVSYATRPEDESCTSRAGADPLYIKATGVYGIFKTDPVISRRDYLRIFGNEGNLALIEQGKVVILCDDDVIRGKITPQTRDDSYYFIRREIERTLTQTEIEGVGTSERGGGGVTLTIYGVHFIPDSPQLLPEEEPRIAEIARTLAAVEGNVTFLVEGHTASVGRPQGELQLSHERANTIMQRLIQAGIARDRITTEGYGGTRPAAGNDTEEGRAQNRRVEITVRLPQ